MALLKRSRINHLLFTATLIGLLGLGAAYWAIFPTHEGRPDEIERLIDQLRKPSNRVRVVGRIVPVGEMLQYSPPMES
jgi:hypothetical protein